MALFMETESRLPRNCIHSINLLKLLLESAGKKEKPTLFPTIGTLSKDWEGDGYEKVF